MGVAGCYPAPLPKRTSASIQSAPTRLSPLFSCAARGIAAGCGGGGVMWWWWWWCRSGVDGCPPTKQHAPLPPKTTMAFRPPIPGCFPVQDANILELDSAGRSRRFQQKNSEITPGSSESSSTVSEGRRDQRGRFWAKIPGIPAHKKVPEPQNLRGIFVASCTAAASCPQPPPILLFFSLSSQMAVAL